MAQPEEASATEQGQSAVAGMSLNLEAQLERLRQPTRLYILPPPSALSQPQKRKHKQAQAQARRGDGSVQTNGTGAFDSDSEGDNQPPSSSTSSASSVEVPSVDPECAAVLMYLALLDFPVEVVVCDNESMSPNGKLPLLRRSDDVLVWGVGSIVGHARRKTGLDLDAGLDNKAQADCRAYCRLVTSHIGSALQHEVWCVQENFDGFALPFFGQRRYPFPLAQILCWQQRHRVRTTLDHEAQFGGAASVPGGPNADSSAEEGLFSSRPSAAASASAGTGTTTASTGNTSSSGAVSVSSADGNEEELYSAAERALAALSIKLGNREFMLGTTPTLLDAVVYGYLATILSVGPMLPHPKLLPRLEQHANLVDLCTKLHRAYLSNKQ